MRYIDFHTHILPEMDDGATSTDEAIAMLKAAKKSGAETVVLTPHYHAAAPLMEFLKRRSKKLEMLKKAMRNDGGEFPEILCGAEVLLNDSLIGKKHLSELCIEGTNLLLVELPHATWNKWHFQEIYQLLAERDVSPVVAHIERYMRNPSDMDKIEDLISIGAHFQINASSFLTFSGRRIIRALAAEGLISAIGSDCHNIKRRSADISRAMNAFSKKFGDHFIDYLYNKTETLLSEHTVETPIQ